MIAIMTHVRLDEKSILWETKNKKSNAFFVIHKSNILFIEHLTRQTHIFIVRVSIT